MSDEHQDPAGEPLPAYEDPRQIKLFDVPQDWEKTWEGMPEFEMEDHMPWQTIDVHFRTKDDRQAFAKLTDQPLSEKTGFIWYPKAERIIVHDKRYVSAEDRAPRHPVYVISKGRWESRLTSKALEALRIPYHLVVEPQEYDAYAAVVDPKKILTLPFSNLGLGSIPARNWVWNHASERGAERHWILDDNIRGFYRLTGNRKIPVATSTIFSAAEDFTDRYENIALSGFQYYMFAPQKAALLPYTLNTRIYSCILIKNDIPYMWRGRYNEDTDLSIRVLKDGYCTVLFNAFLAWKMTTMTMKGGNTDQLYADDGRLRMAESLQEQHPDVVKITWKWGRWQHSVHFRMFRGNKLIPKAGMVIDEARDNYGMELKMLTDIQQP